MGFFSSSRTPRDTNNLLDDDRSVIQAIRSRFYGKSKGKQRESLADVSVSTQPDGDSVPHSPLDPSPHSQSRSQEATFSRSAPRAHTDAITSILAQRLNELAAANAQGLLNDEEYRLLRQNIFERLASGSAIPTETSVIPLGPHIHEVSQPKPEAYTPHQFQVKPRRTPSVRSKASVSSAMSNLFKRGSRRISAASIQESSTTFPPVLLAPSTFKRRAIPPDMKSVSTTLTPDSRHDRSAMSPQSHLDARLIGNGSFGSISRSLRRAGAAEAPPSSFLNRSHDLQRSPSILTSDLSQSDENAKSSQDIRHEIEVMEAEGRRLLDAFNGLELSALTRSRNIPGHTPLPSSPSNSSTSRRNGGENVDSFLATGGNASGRGTPYYSSDADGHSVRSTTSYGTNVSQSRSHRLNPSLRVAGALAAPTAASRKRSMSSLSSRARVPPPALVQARYAELGSASSVSLVRLQTMDEDPEITVVESELFEIRRRRQEVTGRYQDRLEYLRAQLKGAELREKLLRK